MFVFLKPKKMHLNGLKSNLMKKSIYIIPVLFIIIGCKPIKNDARFSGHWYSCAKNGDYIELHIKNNEYKYSTDFGDPTNWNEFEVKGDTLIQYNGFIFEDSTVIDKAKFHFIDKNEFILEYLTSDESWTFQRLDEEIKNVENNLALKNETIERSKIRKCIDNRTDEEKDSLDVILDFQF